MVSDNGSAANTGTPRRRTVRIALLASAALLLSVGIALGWLLNSERGTRFALANAVNWSGGMLQANDVDGTLAGPLRIGSLTVTLPDKTVALHEVQLEWQPLALLRGTLHIESLRVGKLGLTSKIKQSDEPLTLPTNLGLPVKVQIDRVQVDGGDIAWGPMAVITLGGFAFRLDFDGQRYLLDLDRFSAQTESAAQSGEQAFKGSVSGTATLAAASPFALQLTLDASSSTTLDQRTIAARGHVGLQGTLSEIQATVDVHAGQAGIRGKAVLRPFAERPLGATDLRADKLNLAEFAPGLPATELHAALRVNDNGAGQLSMDNAAAGLWNDRRLPLRSLLVAFTQGKEQFRFDRIEATLGSARQSAGRIDGGGRYAKGALTLKLQTDALDLKKLDARTRTTRLAGTLDVRHAGGKQDVTLALREPLLHNPLTLDAHAVMSDEAIAVDRFALRAGSSAVDVSAHIGLDGRQAFDAQATARAFDTRDLGNFSALPQLLLNGELAISGVRQPGLEAALSFRIDRSRLGNEKEGAALSGAGKAQLHADSLTISMLELQAGDNRFSAQGRLAERDARITYSLRAPTLRQLGSPFDGALQVDGEVRGSVRQPRVTAQWQGKQIRAPGEVRIDSTQGKATFGFDRSSAILLVSADIDASAGELRVGQQHLGNATLRTQMAAAANSPLSLALRADGIDSSRLRAEHFALDVTGTTARHQLHATLTEREQNWKIAASGGLQDLQRAPRWQGAIDALDASGKLNAKLPAPAALQISQRLVQLDHFTLDAEDARIVIEQFMRQGGSMATRGHFEHLQPTRLLAYLQPQTAVDADLKLAGSWNLKSNGQVAGSVNVQRESGDIRMLGSAPVALGLTTLTASVNADRGRVAVTLRAEGKQLGRIALDLSTALDRGLAIAPNAPLSGSAQVNTPALGWLGPLVSPALVTEGSLQTDVRISGSIGDPHVSGQIAADKLRLLFTDTGIDLRQGSLRGEFQNDRLLIRTLNFQNGGTLAIAGPISLAKQALALELTINATRYRLLDRSDRKLVVSGNSVVGWREGMLKANGNFTADSGFVDIGTSDAPELSDDVVIVGRSPKQSTKTAIALDLGLDLGKGIRVRGRGLDALLLGQIRLLASAGDTLRAEGTLRVKSGTFKAYGRELAIERGLLRFNGALNNPALDILAMRKGQEVEAGVSVGGTVL
ncbi:MAG TPA: translocation/assembly module TamB domain-containing protein, partial [Oxalicibacterium sp.]|nr:translocation/assembly module TamB domain-containing protein [Oxalicibacterium sp.]